MTAQHARAATTGSYDVPTFAYDVARSGKNNAETTLNTTTVKTIRQVFNTGLATGGALDATPVGASGVVINGSPRNLIYFGDELGGFGAVDADTGVIAWQTNVGHQHTNCGDFPNGDAGVTGAATFDATHVYVAGGDGYLWTFDKATGIGARGTLITSDPGHKHVYGALTLDTAHGVIYATLASYCDFTPYQGTLVKISTLNGASQRFTVMQRTTQSGGGIWGWGGASLDSAGNSFVSTGNALPNGPGEANPYAEYVLKLSPTLGVLGAHHPTLRGTDVDFGATPTLIDLPNGPTGPCQKRLAAENKNGYLYIYWRDNINAGPVETIPIANGSAPYHFIGLPAYDSATQNLYVTVPSDGARRHGILALHFMSNCRLSTTAVFNTVVGPSASPVSPPAVANGVVYYADGLGRTVHAFGATTGTQLWQSASGLFSAPTYGAPMVFNGRLYVPSRGGTMHAFGNK